MSTNGHVVSVERRECSASPDQLVSLCHDLRQYVAAARLALDPRPLDCELPTEVRIRIQLVDEQLHALSEVISAELGHPVRLNRLTHLPTLVGSCVRTASVANSVDVRTVVSADPYVVCDEIAVRRAVNNLLENACRASRRGQVAVRVGVFADQAYVDVEDDGPGFGKVAAGTGLGLEQVRFTAAAHDGRLEVAESRDGGTVVRLLLPVADQQSAC